MRQRYHKGNITTRELAAIYGVSQPLVVMIVKRRTWKHVGDFDPRGQGLLF